MRRVLVCIRPARSLTFWSYTQRNLKPKFSESYGYSVRLNVNGSFGNAQAGLN